MQYKLINLDYIRWNNYINNITKYGIKGYLYVLLEDLNVYKGFIHTTDFIYQENIDYYYRTLCYLNPIEYNYFYNLLNIRHKFNLEYEELIKEESNKSVKLSKDKQKVKHSPKKRREFLKRTTTDLYTGNTIYIYENLYTGEVINSDNPNLLETLNKPKKKEKVSKVKELKFDFSKLK